MVPIDHTDNFLDELSSELQAAFDDISIERDVAAGEVLLRAGCQCSQLYQLCSGKVECRVVNSHGDEAVVATLSKGEWLGLAEMFSGLPASADVIAVTPTRLRVIPNRDFEGLLSHHPALSQHLLKLFSGALSSIYHEMRDGNTLPLKERLMRTLYMLSFSHGKTLSHQQGILIEISQKELSRCMAVVRQTLNRQLKELERKGLIEVKYKSIIVLDLHRFAEHQFGLMRGGRTNLDLNAAEFVTRI